jgi:hypothetical protein
MVVHHRRTRNGAQPGLFALLIFGLVANSSLGVRIATAQSSDKYLFQIESDDAFPDSTLPDRLREFFDDDDGSPLERVPIDLNSDGKTEKFIPEKYLEGTGLCPWLVFDSGFKHLIGRFDAKVIFVLKAKQRGYANLECYCRLGGGLGSVTIYTFNGREYKRISTSELRDKQIDIYFEQRKNVPHPK